MRVVAGVLVLLAAVVVVDVFAIFVAIQSTNAGGAAKAPGSSTAGTSSRSMPAANSCGAPALQNAKLHPSKASLSRLSGWLVATNANAGAMPPAKTDMNIYVIRPDGSGKRYLTSGVNVNATPSWSFDGTKIVYAVVAPNAPAQIWMMDASGANKQQLTFPPSGGLLPQLSPDMRHIVYIAPGPGQNPEVWLMDADGQNRRRLTTTTMAAVTRTRNRIRWSLAASFSPDGRKLVYASTQSGHSEIWLMNADGTNQRPLTTADNPMAPDANAPSWSPDGKRIAFWSGNESERGNIWVMNADGSGRRQLTFEPAMYNSDNPNWSPDGNCIIYESNHGYFAGARTWIMNADGSDARVLLPNAYGIGRLPWKADAPGATGRSAAGNRDRGRICQRTPAGRDSAAVCR
jgi:Tol biopolymer transport system component